LQCVFPLLITLALFFCLPLLRFSVDVFPSFGAGSLWNRHAVKDMARSSPVNGRRPTWAVFYYLFSPFFFFFFFFCGLHHGRFPLTFFSSFIVSEGGFIKIEDSISTIRVH
jgi:hypothetical protein